MNRQRESKEGLSKWEGILCENAEASRPSPIPETACNSACQGEACVKMDRGGCSHIA